MTPQIENLILQIENETGISANTKTRVGNVLRKISEQVDLAVPYTGATQTVDLNDKILLNAQSINFYNNGYPIQAGLEASRLYLSDFAGGNLYNTIIEPSINGLQNNVISYLPDTTGILMTQIEGNIVSRINSTGSGIYHTLQLPNTVNRTQSIVDADGIIPVSTTQGFTGSQLFMEDATTQKTMTFENGILISIT